MNIYFTKIFIFSLVLTIVPNLVLAQESAAGQLAAVTAATPKLNPDEVVVTGKIICLGCYLKREKQANAQCSVYGHSQALLIEKAVNPQGKYVEEVKNKIYHFLPNEQSDKLIADHNYEGKRIIIVGKYYPEAQILEVRFVKIAKDPVAK